MTQETRIIFELSDLERFQITCNQCKQDASFPVKSDYVPCRKCLHCGAPFEGNSWNLFKDMLHKIRQFLSNQDVGIGVHFEIKGESSKKL